MFLLLFLFTCCSLAFHAHWRAECDTYRGVPNYDDVHAPLSLHVLKGDNDKSNTLLVWKGGIPRERYRLYAWLGQQQGLGLGLALACNSSLYLFLLRLGKLVNPSTCSDRLYSVRPLCLGRDLCVTIRRVPSS